GEPSRKRAPSTASLRARRPSVAAPIPQAAGELPAALPAWLRNLDREIAERYVRLATPLNEFGYDPFGFDKDIARYPALIMAAAYRYWFRVETGGLENVPSAGPVLVVANHAGNTFAWDAAMVGTSLFLEADPPRLARGLGEFYLPTIPFFNVFMARAG